LVPMGLRTNCTLTVEVDVVMSLLPD